MDYKGSNNISHPHTSSERAPSSLRLYAPTARGQVPPPLAAQAATSLRPAPPQFAPQPYPTAPRLQASLSYKPQPLRAKPPLSSLNPQP